MRQGYDPGVQGLQNGPSSSQRGLLGAGWGALGAALTADESPGAATMSTLTGHCEHTRRRQVGRRTGDGTFSSWLRRPPRLCRWRVFSSQTKAKRTRAVFMLFRGSACSPIIWVTAAMESLKNEVTRLSSQGRRVRKTSSQLEAEEALPCAVPG